MLAFNDILNVNKEKETYMKRFFVVLLAIAFIIPVLSVFSIDLSAKERHAAKPLEGKTYSILGDSISTYTDVSAGKAADTTNSTIRKSAVHYTPGKWDGVYLEDTWWVQLEEITGLRRLVNNSWSGSAVFAERVGTVGGYIDRCVQLHDDTGENAGEVPDIIFVFLGTNDFSYYQDLLFSEGGVDYDKLIKKTDGGYDYAEPTSVVEAYAIMIHKITVRYPDSELYCFSMMTRRDTNKDKVPQPIEFNLELKAISDRFGAIWVDLFDIGIPSTDGLFDRYFPDLRVHPGVLGMDNVTGAVWSAMLHNSRFIPEGTELCEVKTELVGATATTPPVVSVLKGDSFETKILKRNKYAVDVKVTMGGVDVTADCYNDGEIFIEKVTGDVLIEAREYMSKDGLYTYRWEFVNGENLFSIVRDGAVLNQITQTAGEIVDGRFNKAQYKLDTNVVLFHDMPWTLEWCSEGTFKNASANGGILLSATPEAPLTSPYIFRCEKSIVAIGVDEGGYQNYGIKLSEHGIDTSERHVYRLQNKINADGSNMVYLYVDGVEIGPMTHHYKGTAETGETSDWVSGKDIVLGYMGTKNHPLTNCSIEYLQVWESGAPEVDEEPRPDPDTHTHSHTDTIVAPTCEKGGFTLHLCECGEAYVSDPVGAKGHVYDREMVDGRYLKSDATQTSPAVYYKSCVCGSKGEEVFTFGERIVEDDGESEYKKDSVDPVKIVLIVASTVELVVIAMLLVAKKSKKKR